MVKPRNQNPEGMGRAVSSSGMRSNKGNNRANDACGIVKKSKDYRGSSPGMNGLRRSIGLESSEEFNEALGITKKSRPSGTMSAIEESRHTRDAFVISETNCTIEGLKAFISEREKIRKLKDLGAVRPWTQDPVLDRTRFTNIYRQDDKVSKFIFESCGHLNGADLVYNLLISRLINRIDVLSKVLPTTPSTDLSFLLEGEAVFMNSTAYQVSPMMVKLDEYETNRETIVYYPKTVYEQVHEAMTSTKDIKEAVALGNKAYGGHIRFVMFQVVLDYQYLTQYYDDSSDIPIGQGAQAVVETLGGLDVLSKKLGMKKYDVEHACCEYRKYLYRQGKVLSRYSYKPNSMGIRQE